LTRARLLAVAGACIVKKIALCNKFETKPSLADVRVKMKLIKIGSSDLEGMTNANFYWQLRE
jgi:hypothetical protein